MLTLVLAGLFWSTLESRRTGQWSQY